MSFRLSEEAKSERMEKIENLFDEWGIRHFNPNETFKLSNPKWVDEIGADEIFPPPKMMQENIEDTIKIADRVRSEWGGPVICISGFRPHLYNVIIGGAESSMHIPYRALDLQPANGKYDKFTNHVEKIVKDEREKGKIVGMGKYRTFVHIDVSCPKKPFIHEYNRNW